MTTPRGPGTMMKNVRRFIGNKKNMKILVDHITSPLSFPPYLTGLKIRLKGRDVWERYKASLRLLYKKTEFRILAKTVFFMKNRNRVLAKTIVFMKNRNRVLAKTIIFIKNRNRVLAKTVFFMKNRNRVLAKTVFFTKTCFGFWQNTVDYSLLNKYIWKNFIC
jgi:hypothetical protein